MEIAALTWVAMAEVSVVVTNFGLGGTSIALHHDHNAGGGGVDALVEKDLERFARIRLSIAANSLGDID
jgi:hypothetical protein